MLTMKLDCWLDVVSCVVGDTILVYYSYAQILCKLSIEINTCLDPLSLMVKPIWMVDTNPWILWFHPKNIFSHKVPDKMIDTRWQKMSVTQFTCGNHPNLELLVPFFGVSERIYKNKGPVSPALIFQGITKDLKQLIIPLFMIVWVILHQPQSNDDRDTFMLRSWIGKMCLLFMCSEVQYWTLAFHLSVIPTLDRNAW